MGSPNAETETTTAAQQEDAEAEIAKRLNSERSGCLSKIPIIGWLITFDRVMSEEDR